MAYKITVPQIMRAIPNANRTRVTEFVEVFNQGWGEKFGINTNVRFIHFASQMLHESSCLNAFEENLNYSADGLRRVFPKYFPTAALATQYARHPQKIANRVYANRMGNGSETSGDGWKYRGRGAIMITGRSNYLAYKTSGFCVGDLMAHPEWLAQKPGAYKSAMWFWYKNGLNLIADKDTGERVIDGEAIVTQITKKVNGGLNGIADRRYIYRKLRKEFEIG